MLWPELQWIEYFIEFTTPWESTDEAEMTKKMFWCIELAAEVERHGGKPILVWMPGIYIQVHSKTLTE